MRIPTIRRGWTHRIGPAGRAGILVAAAFVAMILLPSGMALLVHGPGGSRPVQAWTQSWDAHTTLRVYRMETGQVTPMALNDWLVATLAAQLPPDAPMAALQAAAIAARTYAVRALSHPAQDGSTLAYRNQADLTDSPVLDLPLLPPAAQSARFGARDPVYSARFQQAVQSTDGQILTYQGQPILAFLFGRSAGRTRDAEQALGRKIPYLPSVPCPDDAASLPVETLRFSPIDLADRLGWPPSNGAAGGQAVGGTSASGAAGGQAAGGASASGDAGGPAASASAAPDPATFRVDLVDPYGYVKRVTSGGRVWSGTDFAARLGLASTHFTLASDGGKLVVRVEGEGSGIGMSLHEACAMAAAGRSWRDILAHFYPGTRVGGVY
ncbi:SpoIID/LytB domain-containing protein [Alicyclobacillus sp.]|uniref:SpoIID/LytB domain-containing protein n=1 Tax=Alicyclobacillus sp. TaxID=61169 RepID=UPI0025B8DF70|nr:SpoIID/LytB domain-containing protein [Alicyclobacillus sp.]MCL6517965.1 SpoIID/LytB domain-containing protein [Alicyclobacillus sp.]